MRHLRVLLLAAAFAALPVIAACGGDGNGATNRDSNNGDDAGATPSGTPLSDQDYVRTLCIGLVKYQDAILTEPTRDGIATVIKEFAASLRKIKPPEDAAPFHQEFLAYLNAAVDEPTSLVTKAPPRPAEAIRERFVKRVTDTPECKYPTFLGEPRKPSP